MYAETDTELDTALHDLQAHDADDVRMDMLVMLGVERTDPTTGRPIRGVGRWAPAAHSRGDFTVETRGAGAESRRGPARVRPITPVPPPPRASERPTVRVERRTPVSQPDSLAPVRLAPPPTPRDDADLGIAVPTAVIPWIIALMLAMATGVGLLMILAGVLLILAVL